MNKPTILFKYPSRGRKDRFFDGLDSIYRNMADRTSFHVSCTLDTDDPIMTDPDVIERIDSYENAMIAWGQSKSKIDAINRSMPPVPWDIVVVMSDDMQITFYGFDEIIRQQFADGDFDKLIHVPDNDAKSALATMYIAGRTFYNRWQYIYNPIYYSLFCDNEIQEIAQALGKYRYVDCPGMIFHGNPAYGHMPKDDMFLQQQEIGWSADQETYLKRKAINFGL